MALQSATLLFSIIYLYTCVSGERNLEMELDALKLSFDQMKNSHQNEIAGLKEIIYNQGQEIQQLKKEHGSKIKKLRKDVESCLSLYRKWSNAVPVEIMNMAQNDVNGKEDSGYGFGDHQKIKRNAVKSDSVPFLPFRRDIDMTKFFAASPEHYAADTEHIIPLSHIILTLSTPVLPLSIIAERQAGGEKSTNFSVLGGENVQVAFYAYLSHDVINLGANQIIEFDHVITNKGNLYNNTTGIFYCDLPGIYVFSVHILVNPRKVAYTVLTQNNKPVAYIHAQSVDSTYSHGSNTAILQLNHGDSVSVRAHSNYSSTGNVIDEQWSSFSGFLLYLEELIPSVIG